MLKNYRLKKYRPSFINISSKKFNMKGSVFSFKTKNHSNIEAIIK